MAKRSSVVRFLLGERKTLSSSDLDSSVKGDTVGSLGVDSETETLKLIPVQKVKKIKQYGS